MIAELKRTDAGLGQSANSPPEVMRIGSQLIRSAVIPLGFIFCLPLMGEDRDKATPLELGPSLLMKCGSVGELSCLKCHNSSGEAKDSGFILQKTIPLQGVELQNTHVANFKAFTKWRENENQAKDLGCS